MNVSTAIVDSLCDKPASTNDTPAGALIPHDLNILLRTPRSFRLRLPLTLGDSTILPRTVMDNVRKSLALKEKINSALYHTVELRDKAQVRNIEGLCRQLALSDRQSESLSASIPGRASPDTF
jgi:hypothetical protein